uniref:Uncharacterized protein n=1 Tax=Oryza brachyantha TaxID=4533 RepID=J3KYG7_ORYBR
MAVVCLNLFVFILLLSLHVSTLIKVLKMWVVLHSFPAFSTSCWIDCDVLFFYYLLALCDVLSNFPDLGHPRCNLKLVHK